ncbi:ethylene-insensitive protein 2 isoform X1 [Rhodamnia argentea]|uniref:Ethylene-insensitive protein 2 isoform X1 n=1 Tax=Rhodamnia argentea TaxID=178133 RepID=A0A8B8PWL4_9MYRT|nr:ethylene-insensitive protein 2 isoform X1 [Rhodamnia argentea]XP_030538676.1 ethylene-insensitive protein 2 isoform X1 [Rhodamnia argentea]XP_048138697.1 ethylene-insensitive protein 2 isoform X1 [Rhodamnia argentea]XP_048138698.1 ethylene-insensitive protein 2 isoform X1 [Rhodamnia argentea]
MESETASTNHLALGLHRVLPAILPAFLISVGYVDPGKWAANVEGGARFGLDLLVFVLIFNFAAILCQYLSAQIGVVTKRDLAEICSDEYDRCVCILLGIQLEFSMIALDISMIVGMAHALNLLLGADLFSCIFLTAIDAVFYPLFANLLENCKAKLICVCIACFIICAFVFGLLLSQAEIPQTINGVPTVFSGESAFMLISLLGASILPQNFYLHSALIQHYRGEPNFSSGSLIHNHLFAIICVFSCICLASYALMSSAANVFYSAGLVSLTFQDALTLVEQVFPSPIAPFLLLLVLFSSSQATALTWKISGEVVLHNFMMVDIPSWLHRASIRIFAIIPAIYCVWNSGAEGLYQLLIFTQVVVALLLPSSVVPLFRVASSRTVMGIHKISQVVEFLVLITFIGMLGLKIIFVLEMIFGSSDWAGNLRWNIGSNSSYLYVVLVITSCASLGLMLWLATTPLKSASSQTNAQLWNWDLQRTTEVYAEKEESDFGGPGEHSQELGASPLPGKSHSVASVVTSVVDSPVTESDHECSLMTVDDKQSNIVLPNSQICSSEELMSVTQGMPQLAVSKETSETKATTIEVIESVEPVEKTVGVEVDLPTKNDDGKNSWECEELSKGALGSTPIIPEAPGSFRSLSGKSDDGGNGAGSLSRLAGLGRAARRQVAAVLDEFWGQLYDFHGQVSQEAKAKKFDLLPVVDVKVAASTSKMDTSGLDSSAYFPSLAGRGSDPFMSPSMFDSPEHQRVQSGRESPYGSQRGSSALWSNQMQLLDAYVQSSHCGVDAGERRYSSLRLPPSSDGWDNQPATVHGYQIASYPGRIATESSVCFNGQGEIPKSLSLAPSSYKDSNAYSLGQKFQNGLSPVQTSFQNVAVSGNSLIHPERHYYEHFSSSPSHSALASANEKKYRSLPDISGVSVFNRNSGMSAKNAQWDTSIGCGPSVNKTSYEPPGFSCSVSRVGPLAFDELSPSSKYRDALSMQLTSNPNTSSLWSRQPFEQFGVADKSRPLGSIGSKSSAFSREITSVVDAEAMLLQSLRHCILKLLKLEGSDWLFKQNDGADEDLIDKVAAREKFLYQLENREMNNASLKNEEFGSANFLIPSIPHCGDECIYRADLIISFGVWCVHKVLDLSLMESRPELWGKYTYVLNRLQGIIEPAFLKPRTPMPPCFCLQITGVNFQQVPSPAVGINDSLPPAAKTARGKCTTAAMLLEVVKDVETAISGRKGRTGTAAGDVAFPKGKENLASVLKRYKRRLSNKHVSSHEGVRKIPHPASYVS